MRRAHLKFNIPYTGESNEADQKIKAAASLLPMIALNNGIALTAIYENEKSDGGRKHKISLAIGSHHAYLTAVNHHADKNFSCVLQDPGERFVVHLERLTGKPWREVMRSVISKLVEQSAVAVKKEEEVEA